MQKQINNVQVNKRAKKKVKRKKKGKYKWDNISIALLLVAVLLFIGDSLMFSAKVKRIDTSVIEYGNVQSTAAKDMVVVRNDKVLAAPTEGYYELIYPEGERVKKGIPIAKSKSQETIEDYNYLIELLDSRINQISDNKKDFNKEDLNKINNRLEYLYQSAQGRLQSNDIEYIEKIKKEIIALNDKKYYFFPNESTVSKEELVEERKKLVQEKNIKNSTVYSPMTGLVSSSYDGYEEELNLLNMKNITVTQLEKVVNSEGVDYSKIIKKGDPVAVISENYKWYLLCEISKEDIDFIRSEMPVSIIIEDKVITAFLEDFNKGEDGKFVGYFRIEDESYKYYEKRKISAFIVCQSSNGLAIPISALTEFEGQQGVFIVERTGVARFRKVENIAAQNEHFFGIPYGSSAKNEKSAVKLYDEVILNPKGISDGERVK